MKKVHKKNIPDKEKTDGRKKVKKILTLDDTITTLSDESIPRRFRNPISQRWDDTTWF